MSQSKQGSPPKAAKLRDCADIISEAMEIQQQLRSLLQKGQIDKREAYHGISNAEQVILFAQAAMERNRMTLNPISNARLNNS
jgi:hypothetical protein